MTSESGKNACLYYHASLKFFENVLVLKRYGTECWAVVVVWMRSFNSHVKVLYWSKRTARSCWERHYNLFDFLFNENKVKYNYAPFAMRIEKYFFKYFLAYYFGFQCCNVASVTASITKTYFSSFTNFLNKNSLSELNKQFKK